MTSLDFAACDGLRWITTQLDGQTVRSYSRDCRQAARCQRFRAYLQRVESGTSRSTMIDPPEHGKDCPCFVPAEPVTEN